MDTVQMPSYGGSSNMMSKLGGYSAYGLPVLGLLVGFGLGKMLQPAAPMPGLDVNGGHWVRSNGSAFEILLPAGWENISAEANLGVSESSKREVVFREKSKSGSRLFVIQRWNAGKESEKKAANDKLEVFLGAWLANERQQIQKLRQETASLFPKSEGPAKGGTIVLFQPIHPAADGQPAGDVKVGLVSFKGVFYEYSLTTTHPNDTEFLLDLLGTIRATEKFPAEPAAHAAPRKKSPAAAPKKAPASPKH